MEIAPPVVIWGLFTRLLGLVYLVAFASLYAQVVPIAGSRGITPVRELLDRARLDFPLRVRLTAWPSLLWLSGSDLALRGLAAAGLLSAALVVFGGPWSP